MANVSGAVFDRALNSFKSNLKKKDQESFKLTTITQLQETIADLQSKQHSSRRQQNLNRLKPFLEALQQWGKVMDTFANSSEYVAFVWVTSAYADAFSGLLDTYEEIGERIPLLLQYERLFSVKPHMVRILALFYEDVLEFHRLALHYFQQPVWRQAFAATWKTHKSRFSRVTSNMARHRELLDVQATISNIEDVQESLRVSNERFEAQIEKEDLVKTRDVITWLGAANADEDHFQFSQARTEYPETGRWLFDKESFSNWFDPQFPTIPPLLWLTGIPGAGKTVLASFIVEEARKLNPQPQVFFFYCKHEDSQRNSFVALIRSLLTQILRIDKTLVNYFHQKSCESPETPLADSKTIRDLLELGLGNCKSAYIILDGLDECPRDQRKTIVHWFRNLVENLPVTEPERLRCLFVSQDDGAAHTDFSGLASLKIEVDDNKADIDEYCRVEAAKLKEKFKLSHEQVTDICFRVAESSGGMFLLTKLIWSNLMGQTSRAGLERELEPNFFPKTIIEAYKRILARIRLDTLVKDDAYTLLGWLVCAKRPLKWYEIQCLKSMDFENSSVQWHRNKFMVSPKDLCSSLVETRADGSVELVHRTAKMFLVDRDEGPLNQHVEELKMVSRCIEYFNFGSSLSGAPDEEKVLNGDYAFFEYAVLHWVQHLELGLFCGRENLQLLEGLVESLEVFCELHWKSPTKVFPIPFRLTQKLECLHDFDKSEAFYDQIQQAIQSTKKQLKLFGVMKQEETALDLGDTLDQFRTVLETILTLPAAASVVQGLEEHYGRTLFKCPRFSCKFFTMGFTTIEERDAHAQKHLLPFTCTDQTCPRFILGFPSEEQLRHHVKTTHDHESILDLEFPTEQEVLQSVQKQSMEAEVSSSDSKSETQEGSLALKPDYRQQRQQEFECGHCSKLFKKKSNWRSHLLIHGTERPYKCADCTNAFARESDYTRHRKRHTGSKKFSCFGILENGEHWGCGKSFSRADTLSNHQKSKTGQRCLLPLLREQQNRQEFASAASNP